MKKENVKIASVKLINNGLKGIEVKYAAAETRGGHTFLNEFTSKRGAPIHSELEKTFSWLKPFLLDICGYTDNEKEKEKLINNLEMISISYSDKGFTISGKLYVLDGDKVVSLTSPLIIGPDDYYDFEKVESILNGIYSETKEYMDGNKIMSDKDLLERFNQESTMFSKEEIEKMNPDQLKHAVQESISSMGKKVKHTNQEEEENDEEIMDQEPVTIKEEEKTKRPRKEKKAEYITKTIEPKSNNEEQFDKMIESGIKPSEDFTLPPENPSAENKTQIASAINSDFKVEGPTTSSTLIAEDDDDFIIPSVQKQIAESTAKRI